MSVRRRKKPGKSNRRGMLVIAGIVTVLLVVLTMQSQQLSARNLAYESQKAELDQQINDEEIRGGEIDQLKEYINSIEFIEKMAREKLGLVYQDEIIFKAEE